MRVVVQGVWVIVLVRRMVVFLRRWGCGKGGAWRMRPGQLFSEERPLIESNTQIVLLRDVVVPLSPTCGTSLVYVEVEMVRQKSYVLIAGLLCGAQKALNCCDALFFPFLLMVSEALTTCYGFIICVQYVLRGLWVLSGYTTPRCYRGV